MDLVFSASLPAAAEDMADHSAWYRSISRILLRIPVLLSQKFDLKTPGREDDDIDEAEKKVELANNNYTAIAANILEGCGGKENITSY